MKKKGVRSIRIWNSGNMTCGSLNSSVIVGKPLITPKPINLHYGWQIRHAPAPIAHITFNSYLALFATPHRNGSRMINRNSNVRFCMSMRWGFLDVVWRDFNFIKSMGRATFLELTVTKFVPN